MEKGAPVLREVGWKGGCWEILCYEFTDSRQEDPQEISHSVHPSIHPSIHHIFFLLFRAAPVAYAVPREESSRSFSCRPTPQPQQRQI